jgi:hypothetical protein
MLRTIIQAKYFHISVKNMERGYNITMNLKSSSSESIWGLVKSNQLIERSLHTGIELRRICLKTLYRISYAYDLCEIGSFLYVLDGSSLHRIDLFSLKKVSYTLPGLGHSCCVSWEDLIYILGVTSHVFYIRTGAFKHISELSVPNTPARCIYQGSLYLVSEMGASSFQDLHAFNLSSLKFSNFGLQLVGVSGSCLFPVGNSKCILAGGQSLDIAYIIDLQNKTVEQDSILIDEAGFLSANYKRVGNFLYVLDSYGRMHKYDSVRHTWKIYSDYLWKSRKGFLWYCHKNKFGDGQLPLHKLSKNLKKMICYYYL